MKKKEDKYKKGLTSAYVAAGRNYLGFRLRRVFGKIESEKDKILHNDIMADIDILIGTHGEELLTKVADEIIMLANKGA